MTGETFYELLADIDERYLAEAEAAAPKAKRPRRRRWLAAAACFCIIAGAALNTLTRFGWLPFSGGHGANPGTIVDGVYYYYRPHSGVWSYTPETGSQKELSSYWMSEWEVNEYGIYYWRGLSLYVREHETGKRKKLHSAGWLECSHIRFDLLADGNVVFIGYNKHTRIRYELLLDGKTGELIETVMEPTAYDDVDLSYSEKFVAVGDRRLEIVPSETAYRYDILEDGRSLLPEHYGVYQYSKNYWGENLWIRLRCFPNDGDRDLTWLLLRPDGSHVIYDLGRSNFGSGINDYLFYDNETADGYNTVVCLDYRSGESWELRLDTETTDLYAFTMDSEYLYSCAPWDEEQVCWRIIYEDGRPAALELVSADIAAEDGR